MVSYLYTPSINNDSMSIIGNAMLKLPEINSSEHGQQATFCSLTLHVYRQHENIPCTRFIILSPL